MPITENRLTIANTKFFKSFVPFQSPANTNATNNINDMVSINYIRGRESSIIKQDIGAKSSYVMDLQIKNITINTELEINVSSDILFTLSETKFILGPGTTRTIFIQSNNDYINEQTDNLFKSTNVKVTIKNVTTNLSYIQNNVIKLQKKAIPTEIVVT